MSHLRAEPLSRIRSEPLDWLWEPYLPRGKLCLLDGDPGIGKSLLTIDLAARLSRGDILPNGSRAARPFVTLLLSAEDAAADTTRPRAEAAGADLDRLILASADCGPLSLPAQLPELENLIRSVHAELVVIDPVMAFLPPDVAANADQCVRRALTPLTAVAAQTGCAVLLVRHLRKSPAGKALYRGLGSIGIIAAARTGWLAARDPADPSRGVLAVTKSNVVGSVPALGYRVVATAGGPARVEWTGPADTTADQLFRTPEAPLRPRDRAVCWLQTELARGPRKAAEMQSAAAAAGIPEATLKRAKAELGVDSHLVHAKERKEWYWFDPAAPWPKDAPFKKPFELPPLPDLDPMELVNRRIRRRMEASGDAGG